jgi:hypothetical protein
MVNDFMKEYVITIKIDVDTIGIAVNKNRLTPFDVYRIIWSSIRNAYRHAETSYPVSIGDYSLEVPLMEGGDLLILLAQIREDLEHNLKLKPEEVKLALISIKDKETKRQIF